MLCTVFNAKFICQGGLVYLNFRGTIYRSLPVQRNVDNIDKEALC
jgi:hypothetical protein